MTPDAIDALEALAYGLVAAVLVWVVTAGVRILARRYAPHPEHAAFDADAANEQPLDAHGHNTTKGDQ